MAWPFSKAKLETPPRPPSPVKKKVTKVVDGLKEITKLAKGLGSINKDFDIFRKEVDDELKTLNKGFAPILDKNEAQEKEISELRANSQKLAKSTEGVRKSVESLHAEFHDGVKPLGKNIAAVLDKNMEQDSKIKDLEAIDNKMLSTIDGFERDIDGMKDIIKDVENTFSIGALDKLSNSIKSFGKTLNKMEEDDDELVKSLEKVDRRIGNVERKAADVEMAQQEAKNMAEMLSQNAEEFKSVVNTHTENMVAMSSKVNAALNQYTDIEQMTVDLQNRMRTIENQLSLLNQNSQILSELARKVAYLEKTTSKTIVVD